MATTAAVLNILVTAQTGQATAALARTDTQLKKTAVTAQGASTSMGAKIAKGAKVGGLALAALAAVSIKAAADWESAFAEVRKTVDTSEKGFARLEKGLRNLAKEIPISAVELANLAGQAGALGIKAKDIVKFTKTAAELGITTDLSAEAAANALARLSNIMGTSSKDFRRLGSTMVELGNKGASTESEIAEMALRIAGAGKVIGLTEADVLGFSSALASVGVRAEAGGSAISRAFITIAEAAEKGGGELRGFADVAGLSVGKFGQMFKKDAASAMVLFIEGLDKIRKSGGDVFGTLEKLNLNEIRVRDSLLRAAGAGDLFRKALKTGSDEWARNTALTEEANKRYNTTSAQFQIFKNRVTDVFISIGQFLNPAVRGLLKLLNTLSFKDIIADIKRFVRTNEEMRAFLQSVRNIATVLKTVFGPVVREVFRQARIVVGNLLDAFQGLLQGMRGIVRIITGLLTGDFRLAWRGVKDIFSGGAKFVVGVMRAMVTPVLAPLRILGKAMREIFKGTWAAIKTIFRSGLDAIIGFINAIIGVINVIPGVPDIGKIGAGGRVSAPAGLQGPIGRQRGGPIFGGQPSGDTVPAMLERGEYVLNRKAVAAVGRKQLDAVNFASAPRYAIGGAIGNAIGGAAGAAADLVGKGAGYFLGKLPKPNLPDPFGALGPYLIGEVSSWIKDGFQSKKMGSFTGLGGFTGAPASFRQLGDNRWVDSHTMAVGAYMARKFGVSITDGWRPQNAGYGAPNSSHKRGTPANPGALDFAPSSRAFQSYAGKHIAGLTENLYNDPYSTGPHNHLAFFRKGGLVPGFASGGMVPGMQIGGSPQVKEDFAKALHRHQAPYKAAVALYAAGLQESGLRDLGYGDSSSTGSLQLLSSTASGYGIDPHNEFAVAKGFLTHGYWGKGGGIELAKRGIAPDAIAQLVQGSAHPSLYADNVAEASSIVREMGLRYDGQTFKGRGAAGAGKAGEAAPAAPTEGYFPYPPQGDLGPIPNTVVGCNKQITRLRGKQEAAQGQLVRVRGMGLRQVAIAGQNQHLKKSTQAAAVAAWTSYIKALRARIKVLIVKRTQLQSQAARKVISRTIGRFGELPAHESAIANYFGDNSPFTIAQETAATQAQYEPITPELPESIKTQAAFDQWLTPFTDTWGTWHGTQTGLTQQTLGKEWTGRQMVTGGIGAASSKLGTVQSVIDWIVDAVTREKRKPAPNWDAIRNWNQVLLPQWRGSRTKLQTLRSGWRTNELPQMQGRGITEATLPALPMPYFGQSSGAIWQSQDMLKSLLAQVSEKPFFQVVTDDLGAGGDGGSGAPDRSAEIELLRQLLEQAQRTILTGNLQSPVGLDFAGYYAQGGPIPGPIGKPYAAVVHGGEEVLTRAQRRGGPIVVQLIVEDGAVDINKIRAVASDEVQVELRKVARGIQTSSPSSVGRQTAVG